MSELELDSFVLRQVPVKRGGKRLKLDGSKRTIAAASLDVVGLITGAELERTIEGASTLTVTLKDPDDAVLLSGLLDRDRNDRLDVLDVKVDGQWWRLAKVAVGMEDLTLVFEDRGVALLRLHKRREKVNRETQTRAEFVKRLVRQVKYGGRIQTYIPELHDKQRIAAPKREEEAEEPGA